MTVQSETHSAGMAGQRRTYGSIGRKLIVAIVVFSSFITLVTTAIQLYRDYLIDVGLIERQFSIVEESFSSGIAQSLWLLDGPQLNVQLAGILRLRDVVWAGIEEAGEVTFEIGVRPADFDVVPSATIPVEWVYNQEKVVLGRLKVAASLEGVYERLLNQVWVILISNGIKTFFVSIFVYYLFRYLVTRHLEQIAAFMRSYRKGEPVEELSLDRKPPDPRKADEIDALVLSLNRLLADSSRRQSELKSHRNRLRAILAAVPDAIIAVDPDLVVRGFNPAAEEIFGWQRDDILGQPLGKLIPASETGHDALAKQFFASDLSGHRAMFAGRVVKGLKRDGRTLPMKVALSMAETSEGKLAVAVVTDMSMLEKREKEVEQKNQQIREQLIALQDANEVKRRFIASLSHELRTPLNAIIGFSDILLMPGPMTLSEEKKREYLGDVRDAGAHLLSLVNGLLDIARIEKDGMSLASRPFDLAQLIHRVGRILTPEIARQNQNLVEVVPANLRMPLGDETAVQQVLINLLSNASKFSPDGSDIRIMAEFKDGMVRVQVEDNGPGIPADRIGDLAQPFVQLGDHWAGSATGLGLGLAISRLMIEEMGGELTIESEEGQWTRIGFSLPPAPAAVSA